MTSGKHVIQIALGIGLLMAMLTACTSSPIANAPMDDQTPITTLTDEYRIGIDDVIQVNVWRNPELSVTVPVRPDGKITVPLGGDIQAGGRTSNEVAEAIREKLAVYVRDPQVTVIVAELRSNEFLTRVRVTGAVKSPSSMPYRQGMTVLDVVLQAGGISEFAAPDRTVLYRKRDSEVKVYPIRLNRILQKGELETNFNLQPGDIVTVPERLF